MSKNIVTLGEIMLRLSTTRHQRLTQSSSLHINFGGGEANVAEALCHYGCNGKFVTKLPQSPMGQLAVNSMKRYGMDTQWIARGGDRIGIYFLEPGASMRSSRVTYDRENSAFAEAQAEDFNFDEIFEDADWFHTSGITPALSENAAAITEKAFRKAKEKGLTTSFDINYRQKLWSKEDARTTITRLCPYIDVLIGVYVGEQETEETLLGLKSSIKNNGSKSVNIDRYKDIFQQLQAKYQFDYIASTFREIISSSDNGLYTMLYDGKQFHQSKKHNIRIVDRIGGGDSFASGLIFALMNNMPTKEAADFAIAASALKHTIPGDFNHVTSKEIKDLVAKSLHEKPQRDIFYRN